MWQEPAVLLQVALMDDVFALPTKGGQVGTDGVFTKRMLCDVPARLSKMKPKM